MIIFKAKCTFVRVAKSAHEDIAVSGTLASNTVVPVI